MTESDRVLQPDFSPIAPFLEQLLTAYPKIESVWLIGSRANETARDDSDWDLLVFASREVFEALSKDDSFSRPDVDLLVVYDGDNFESPYSGVDDRKSKKGSLQKWEWRHFSFDFASYEACKPGEGIHIDIERRSGIKIWPNQKVAFLSYIKDYPRALRIILQSLGQTSLPKFEELTIRLMHALESKQLQAADEESEEFFNTMMCKLVNECLGFIGCLKAGTDLAAYHHARAVWELYAALNYALGDEQQRAKRIKRFNEFHGLQQYNHCTERRQLLQNGTISQEEFEHTCHVSTDTFERLKQNVSEWTKLWDVKREDLWKIKHWHGKVSIEAMFGMLHEDSNAWSMYGLFCHGTHLSPSARRMTSGLRLIGFPRQESGEIDLRSVENLIGNMILALQRVVLFLFKNTDNPLVWEIINHEVVVNEKANVP
jgi:predicted nucleotidyltransferase